MSITQMMINSAHPSGPRDEYFSNVALLFDGQSFTDQSSYGHSVTTSSVSLSTGAGSPYSDGTTAYLMNAESDTFYTGTLSSSAVGTGAFTIEFWVYFNGLRNWSPLFTSRNSDSSSWLENTATKFVVSTDGNGQLYFWSGGTNWASGGNIMQTGVWQYVAFSREAGGSCHLYRGTTAGGSASRVATGTNTVNYTGNNYGIGGPADNAHAAANEFLNGYIRDVRFTPGIARYNTSTITAPSESFPTQ